MNNKENEPLETLKELEAVAKKLPMMFDVERPRCRLPVDCVAFDAVEVLGKGWVHPSCHHPDRGGPIFGCVLVEEPGRNNVVKRKRRVVCPYRVKKRARGSAALRVRIRKDLGESIWDFS